MHTSYCITILPQHNEDTPIHEVRPPPLEKNHPLQLNVIKEKDDPAKNEGGTDTPVVRQVSRKEVSADAKCYMKIPQPPKSLVHDILQPSNGDSAIVEERQRPHVSLRRLTYRRRKLMERRGDLCSDSCVTFVLTSPGIWVYV